MWDKFEIGFWHPFGPYTGLSAAQVLDWKGGEVERHGWTLWSFVYSPTAAAWLELLSKTNGPVYALCSHSPGARDPDAHQGSLSASHYRYLSDTSWQAMPDPKVMKVTNPFKRQGLALGFKVSRVIALEPVIPPFGVEWYSRGESSWRSDRVPTRGEFLVRRGGSVAPRRVCAVLELARPYLAVLKREPESSNDPTPLIPMNNAG
jgi:hypothetical protein